MLSLSLITAFISLLAVNSLPRSKISYEGYKVVEVIPRNDEDSNAVQALQDAGEIDCWLDPSGPGSPTHFLVSPSANITSLAAMNVTTLIEDVASLFEEERESIKFNRARLRDSVSGGYYSQTARYNSLYEIESILSNLTRQYPNIVEIRYLHDSYGNTVRTSRGRSIMMAKIGTPQRYSKQAIWIDGGLHAREWISMAVALWIAERVGSVLSTNDMLATRYGSDSTITRLVDSLDWYIVPVANPDGYDYTWTDDRVWRKNLNPNGGGCWGVDINRNFNWDWGLEAWIERTSGHGTSADPCRAMYGGTGPASEPETQGIQETIWSLSGQLAAVISLHSYSQLWMYPYASAYGELASNWQELERIAYNSVNKLAGVYGTTYRTGTPANQLCKRVALNVSHAPDSNNLGISKEHAASGTSTDWAKGVAGIRYTYVLELRPALNHFNYKGFSLPESQIVPTAAETFAGIEALADTILDNV